MNYGEELAYWYLRLNGFFPITNFVVHNPTNPGKAPDIDVLAIRLPHVEEKIGGQPSDWHDTLQNELDFSKIIGVICEVKTGRLYESDLFKERNIKIAVQRLGFSKETEPIIDCLSNNKKYLSEEKNETAYEIGKLLITNKTPANNDKFICVSLSDVNEFIKDRILKYPKNKKGDRIQFNSNLLQYIIHFSGESNKTEQKIN